MRGDFDEDARGLSVDMLDVDRLREWARLLLVHGADISHWASVPHVASKLQTLATGLEKAIRDIGSLRAEVAAVRGAEPRWQPIESAPVNAAIFAACKDVTDEPLLRIVINFGDEKGWQTVPGLYTVHPTHWHALPDPPRLSSPSASEE